MNQKGKGKSGCAKQQRKRILIVDPQPLARERLAQLINREADLTARIVAEGREAAMEAIKTEPPDLVVTELSAQDLHGRGFVQELHERWPGLLVLVLSGFPDAVCAERALRAGARGYLSKQEPSSSVLAAVRNVLNGELWLEHKTAEQVLARLAIPVGDSEAAPERSLAERELDVFQLLGSGFSTREIAESLRIGAKTVETYRARIKEKLGLRSSNELLRLAISWVHRKLELEVTE